MNKHEKCRYRKRFTSKMAAETAAFAVFNRNGVRLAIEPCSDCNGFHLVAPYPRHMDPRPRHLAPRE